MWGGVFGVGRGAEMREGAGGWGGWGGLGGLGGLGVWGAGGLGGWGAGGLGGWGLGGWAWSFRTWRGVRSGADLRFVSTR